MDFEKEYKRKALEPIVSYIESVMASYSKEELEAIIKKALPEKESEDERIRKEIIGYLESKVATAEETELLYFKRWIAYLKKQKDASKAIEAVDRIDKYIDEHVANAHDMKDSNPEKKYYSGWDDALGKMAGILQDVYSNEKQKEQKPLSTEETELNSIAFLEQLGYTCIPPGAEQKCTNSEKPKEWSEEDEGMLNCIIATLCEESHGGRESNRKMVTWLGNRLKSLRPQTKAEWNKEDETMWSNLIGYLDGKFGMLPSGKERYIKWLTERFVKLVYPKPNWKPNNEQIEVYTDAIYFLAKHGFKDPNGVLESLYNDIKKLM